MGKDNRWFSVALILSVVMCALAVIAYRSHSAHEHVMDSHDQLRFALSQCSEELHSLQRNSSELATKYHDVLANVAAMEARVQSLADRPGPNDHAGDTQTTSQYAAAMGHIAPNGNVATGPSIVDPSALTPTELILASERLFDQDHSKAMFARHSGGLLACASVSKALDKTTRPLAEALFLLLLEEQLLIDRLAEQFIERGEYEVFQSRQDAESFAAATFSKPSRALYLTHTPSGSDASRVVLIDGDTLLSDPAFKALARDQRVAKVRLEPHDVGPMGLTPGTSCEVPGDVVLKE